jgi:20S proteasome alpha/beta subunit
MRETRAYEKTWLALAALAGVAVWSATICPSSEGAKLFEVAVNIVFGMSGFVA